MAERRLGNAVRLHRFLAHEMTQAELGERVGALLATTLVAKGYFDGEPYDVGIAGSFSGAITEKLLAEADLVIGVDAPDFNLGLEKSCQRAGLRTVHFVSPSVWAWREKRATRIAESCEQVLCLFPMEPAIYAKYGVDARYVGHPLADRIAMQPDRDAARIQLALPVCRHVAILPGSRVSEIDRLLPLFLQGAARLQSALPDLHFLIPAANMLCRNRITVHLHSQPLPNVRILDGQAQAARLRHQGRRHLRVHALA